jgi:ankyrin repeat protein
VITHLRFSEQSSNKEIIMQGLPPPKHTDDYNNISRFELQNKQATLNTIREMNADDKALLLSKLIECKYYRQTGFFNNVQNIDKQNACWQFILDCGLWSKEGLSDLMAFIKNDGWDIVQRKLPSEFKKLLSNLSTDERQKILTQFTVLRKDEQENIRVFLVDATGEHWSPQGVRTSSDSPILTEEITTNPEKVIAQLVHQTITSFSASATTEADGDLVGYLNLIRAEAKVFVAVAVRRKDKVGAKEVEAKEFHLRVLEKVIAEAVDHNDIVTARKFLRSPLFNAYRSELTNKLIFSYCRDYGSERASIQMFELLHEIKADFNCYDSYGNTPLLVAVNYNVHNVVAVVGKLIELGADVNKNGERNIATPFMEAAYNGNVKLVQLLLKAGAKIEITALALITDQVIRVVLNSKPSKELPGYCQVIGLLVKAGASLERKDFQGHTPLKNAVLNGMWPFAEFLISSGASIYPDIFNDAIKSNNEECIRQLAGKKLCSLPEAIPYCPSLFSPESEIELEIFRLCLDSGMSARNFSLANDVVLKTPKAVKECLDREPNLNINISEPDIRSQLFSGNSPGAQGCSLAHLAAACATRESLAILIHAGLDIHARDARGLTPLHYAASYANSEAVKLLIFAGAAIDAVDQRGMTPLHWAVRNGMAASIRNLPCARILLYAGAKPDLKDQNNRLPLDCLYRGGCTDSEERKWERAFKETKPREFKKLTAEDAIVPSLKALAFNALVDNLVNNSALTKNLLYRNNLPEDFSLQIEEMVSQILTPPNVNQTN